MIPRLLASSGMLAVLALLCAFFTWATYHQEYPAGREAGEALASELRSRNPGPTAVLVVATPDSAGMEFTSAFEKSVGGHPSVVGKVIGEPAAVREAVEGLLKSGRTFDTIATTQECSQWTLWQALRQSSPGFARVEVVSPRARARSTFLSTSNLRNVADQIAVIAILAVGMTMVIITGGIDLSVGSLIAVSAVLTAWLIQRCGGESASVGAMLAASAAGVALCGGIGAVSGLAVTRFRIPPFIATLAMMQVASGLAFIIARGQSIYNIPASFTWLGRGADLLTVPNAVVLMALVYLAAHVLMSRTTVGRHIYAVGGSAESARLSGVDVRRTLLFVYLVSGLAAGIGGVVTVSQLKAGAPTYGLMYELYVIAAVVVGGTSLSGGEGRVLNTLVGAFIIAVIRNGMNLVNLEPYSQKVVLGLVILGAVMLDMLKRRR